MSVVAFVALGSNLGDRAANVRAAVDRLRATPGVVVDRVSRLLDNAAVGGPAGSPPYLNGVAAVTTTLDPHELLGVLLGIETEMGRRRRVRWDPRPIDLDVLLFGDRVVATEALTVPHPRMHERRFVLEPLAQVAPDVRHPTLGRTIAELLAAV